MTGCKFLIVQNVQKTDFKNSQITEISYKTAQSDGFSHTSLHTSHDKMVYRLTSHMSTSATRGKLGERKFSMEINLG